MAKAVRTSCKLLPVVSADEKFAASHICGLMKAQKLYVRYFEQRYAFEIKPDIWLDRRVRTSACHYAHTTTATWKHRSEHSFDRNARRCQHQQQKHKTRRLHYQNKFGGKNKQTEKKHPDESRCLHRSFYFALLIREMAEEDSESAWTQQTEGTQWHGMSITFPTAPIVRNYYQVSSRDCSWRAAIDKKWSRKAMINRFCHRDAHLRVLSRLQRNGEEKEREREIEREKEKEIKHPSVCRCT